MTALVERIQSGDEIAVHQLYELFSAGIRHSITRALGVQDAEDISQEAFLAAVAGIRAGQLRNPECVLGFMRTITRRFISLAIERRIHERRGDSDTLPGKLLDRRLTPEEALIQKERAQLGLRVLESLNERQREILTRFYLDGQTREQICCEMGLTDTQFRLAKSRAKDRFGELGRREIRRPLVPREKAA